MREGDGRERLLPVWCTGRSIAACTETHTPGSTQCCWPRALRLYDWGLWSPTLSQEVPLALGRIHFHLEGSVIQLPLGSFSQAILGVLRRHTLWFIVALSPQLRKFPLFLAP